MDKHIKEILKELYQDDPRMKLHADELRTELEALLTSRPTGTVDKTFKESLRSQLLKKAATLSPKKIQLHTITNNKKSMATNNIESWVHEMRTHGTSDADIRTLLKKSGWTDAQVDGVLPQAIAPEKVPVDEVSRMISGQKNKKERKPKGERKPISPKRFKIYGTVASAAFVLLVMYTVGAIFGVPWDASTQRGTNALKLGYVSNTSTYTGDTIIPTTYSEQLAAQSTIGKFENYDQLTAFLDDHSDNLMSGLYGDMAMETSSVVSDFSGGLGEETFGLGSADLELPSPLGSSRSSFKTSQSSPDYSRTNVQVEGVDEADIVKSDGKYIYTVNDSNVVIVDAYPAETSEIITTITLDSRPQDIYINGPTLVVFGREDNIYDKPFAESLRMFSGYTYFEVYDLTDITKPKQVRDLLFEGSYVNSRMIGNYVYFITSNPTLYYDEDMPVPLIIEDGELLPIDSSVARCNCPDVYYIDAYYPQYYFTSVAAIDIGNNEKAITSDVYLLSSGENMYVSPDNIYIVYTKYVSEFYLMLDAFKEVLADDLSKKDLQRIDDIEAAPLFMLSQEEKTMKVYMILMKYIGYDTYSVAGSEDETEELMEKVEAKVKELYVDISKELEKTVIHKIAIDGGELEYAGSGEVTGHVLNQFAMDEHDGYFRIATTKGRVWSSFGMDSDEVESYSNVYVLDKDLDVVGSVEKLAKGEEIYSTRFMQGRVYLVTFRQVDPLFAVDLTNPRNPVLLGELKIPGFSSYLHPYDDNLLIGFGKQGTESGQIEGLKLSLFDVSDVSNLKEVDTYVMGDSGSDSIALNDHKAFLFSKSKNLLVIPVTLREEKTDESYSYDYTHGAMVFTVTPEGFSFEKRIDHSDGSSADSDSRYYYGNSYYGTSVKRSLYIDNILYTLSDSYLKAHTLGTLNEARSITFPTETTDNDVYYLE